MASTKIGYLAIKKETTAGTAVKPSHFLKTKGGDIFTKKEIIENSPIMNNRYEAICPLNGATTNGGTHSFDLDAIESVHFLYYGLGTITTTDIGSTPGAVYQHVLTLANALPTFTLEQGKGNLTDTTNNLQNYLVERAYGSMIDKITITSSNGVIGMSVDTKSKGVFSRSLITSNVSAGSSVVVNLDSVDGLIATDTVNLYDNTPKNETDPIASLSTTNKTITIASLTNTFDITKGAKVELTPQTPSFSGCKVFTYNSVNAQFGTDLTTAGTATETNLDSWEFTYTNNLKETPGSAYNVIDSTSAKANFKYTKYFENRKDYDDYLAMNKTACIITITNNEIVATSDTNKAKYTIKLELSDVRYTTAEIPTGENDIYAVNVEGTCFYDGTDGRALRITAINNQAGTIYTA